MRDLQEPICVLQVPTYQPAESVTDFAAPFVPVGCFAQFKTGARTSVIPIAEAPCSTQELFDSRTAGT